jgi:hypothetical protein
VFSAWSWRRTRQATRSTHGSDGGRLSRYEAGRITQSADALVRLVKTFNTSINHLLIDDAPRRPFRTPNNARRDRLAAIAELDSEALGVIDGLLARTRLSALTGGLN